jgi:hypothetical protein
VSQHGIGRTQKRISVTTAREVAQLFWPDFIEINGCIFAAFQCYGGVPNMSGGKSEAECFINHTHILDEFRNRATSENCTPYLEALSETVNVVEATYNEMHPDFISACDLGVKIARMWAAKLKLDFPQHQFRVYYTQYDNPIVRFHKVRMDEPVWLSDDALNSATDPSFRNAVIYDTDYLDSPCVKSWTERLQ